MDKINNIKAKIKSLLKRSNETVAQEDTSSYRQIMKATTLFGGVQIFNIIINVIRSKFVAVLLGPAGMGIAGLMNSTINLVGGLTNFGLRTSAVKEIATANSLSDNIKISQVISTVKIAMIGTGLLGMIIVIILSPFLSKITFGNDDYRLAFILLSVVVLIVQLSNGQLALLQGLKQLKSLAKANLFGSFFSLIITIPLYYLYGIKGIVPGIIMASLGLLITSWFYAKKIELERVKVTISDFKIIGKSLFTLGFMLSLSSLSAMLASYLLRIFISKVGDVEQVGLYNAGFSIINTYVGMIFTAMASDYYPRLSSVALDNSKSKDVINQQAEIALLVIGPIILIFIVFIKYLIILLYSEQFIDITEMINWAALGMFFKAASWSISFILLAKGESRLFFIMEFSANIYMLVLNCLGYYLLGLEGLGIAFVVGYLFYFIQMYFIARKKYNFRFAHSFNKIFSIQLLLGVVCFITIKFLTFPISVLVGVLLIILSSIFSIYKLNDMLNIREIIKNKLR